MDRADQIQIVRDLSEGIAHKIVDAIKNGIIPEDWDGHELRVLLSSLHAQSSSMSTIHANPRGQRARDFRNFMNTCNCGF